MPRKLPPFVECWRDRHGKVRAYYRRDRGPRIALPNTIGSPEFNARLSGMRSQVGCRTRRSARPAIAAQGTLEALVRSYMQSREYRDLRATTKTGYASRLEAIRHEARTPARRGDDTRAHRQGVPRSLCRPPRRGAVDPKDAAHPDPARHHARLADHDPSLGIKRPKQGEVRSWSDAELAQFEARWPIATPQRLAFALMLYTGQRRSDIHRMTWADVTGNTIRVVQQKTGAKLTIPLHADLRAILTETKRKHVAILTTEYGRAFTVDGFSGFMRDAIKAAGLPLECQPHGLRKAAGRRLAEAGCSSRELMAVLGHKTLSEAERYTRDADQARLASAAVARLEGRSVNS